MDMEILKLFAESSPGYLLAAVVIIYLFRCLKEKDKMIMTILGQLNDTSNTLVELVTLVKVLIDRRSQ